MQILGKKSQYMLMSCKQNTGKYHNIKISNNPLRVQKTSNIWKKH